MRENYNYFNVNISGNLNNDLHFFKKIFMKDSILRIRKISVGTFSLSCAVLYFDGMVSSSAIYESIIAPIVNLQSNKEKNEEILNFIKTGVVINRRKKKSLKEIYDLSDYFTEKILCCDSVIKTNELNKLIESIISGDTILLIDGCKNALCMNTKGYSKRSISEPVDERILQGPREGFCESAMVNLSLIRRKLSTPDLCLENIKIGVRSGTMVYICYLGNLASKKIVKKLKVALSKINIDGILDTNYLAEIFMNGKSSIFKTSGNTERPDVVAARLLEGRIAIIVDGSPMALTLPYLFAENFQSDEDYYQDFLSSSVGRILRYLCFFLSFSVPSVYLALTVYHKNLLPTAFLLAVSTAREGVPFSSTLECVLLIAIFEILKEAGLRTQQSFGQALSIVGGLVVGQAAVEAKIVSIPMLIAVALSGIAGLMVPRLRTEVLYLRFIFIFMAASFGLFGYFMSMCALIAKISSLKSFGEDQTPELKLPSKQNLKDTIFRVPITKMKFRPSFNKNKKRMENFQDITVEIDKKSV